MGYYMNNFGEEDPFSKVKVLMEKHGADYHFDFLEPKSGLVTICVVANPDFEAVGIAYDKREFDAFSDLRDERPKIWLSIATEKAEEFAPGFAVYMKEQREGKSEAI